MVHLLQTLRSSDVVDLKYRNGLATLNIAEVFPEDEGEYVCRASNSLGTVESKCRLTITRKFVKYMYIIFHFHYWRLSKLQ